MDLSVRMNYFNAPTGYVFNRIKECSYTNKDFFCGVLKMLTRDFISGTNLSSLIKPRN